MTGAIANRMPEYIPNRVGKRSEKNARIYAKQSDSRKSKYVLDRLNVDDVQTHLEPD